MALMSIIWLNLSGVAAMSSDHFIDLSGSGGPSIFAKRLSFGLIESGCHFNPSSTNRISIIEGQRADGANNILRLDGLYFHKNDPRNSNIFSCYDSFDHIVFQGEFCRDQYEAFTETKRQHTIIRNGAPKEFFKRCEQRASSRKRIVASASWRRHKRLEETVEAFKDSRLENVDLFVLGGANYWNKSFPKNVHMLPQMNYSRLYEFLRDFDAMVHLSWLDWCPNSVVEGLASGLPVLCSHNGGTKELVKDNGVIIQLEEDYIPGTELDLYSPPKVNIDTIVDGILEVLEVESGFIREDLKIENVAQKYLKLFN